MRNVIAYSLIGLLGWQCMAMRPAAMVDHRPNIIFLLADDLRYDALRCNGNSIAITPNLDSLALQGTNFKKAYVTTAICAISRASYLSGQYERRHNIDDFSKSFSDSALRQTYPLLLRGSGYYTGFIGKYGVGNKMPAYAFDYWRGFAGHGVYFHKDEQGKPVHETALMGQQAKEFIAGRDPSKPFCLSVSFKAPHSQDGIKENNGFLPDRYFNNWYGDVQFPLPVTYGDSFYLQFSPAFRRDAQGRENEARVRWLQRFSTSEKYQTTVKAIYRLVSGIDKVVGELRNYLKAQGLDRNTIIVFSSDNGYYMGEHGLEGKWYGHEESIHVPLVVYDGRNSSKRPVADEMVLNIDLAPTILQWAGVPIPLSMQGKALQPLLTAIPHTGWRKDFFYEHRYDPGTYPVYIPHTVGIVTKNYKYMRYYTGNRSDRNLVHEEFFNTATDPFETRNLVAEQGQQKKIIEMKKRIATFENSLQ
jgi:arylsulfatase A-like enzyme